MHISLLFSILVFCGSFSGSSAQFGNVSIPQTDPRELEEDKNLYALVTLHSEGKNISIVETYAASDSLVASSDESSSNIVPAVLACALVIVLLVPLALWKRKRNRLESDVAQIMPTTAEPRAVKARLRDTQKRPVIFQRNWTDTSSIVGSGLHWDESANPIGKTSGVEEPPDSHSRLRKEATSNSHASSIFSADTDNDNSARLNHFDACYYELPDRVGGDQTTRLQRPVLGYDAKDNVEVRVPRIGITPAEILSITATSPGQLLNTSVVGKAHEADASAKKSPLVHQQTSQETCALTSKTETLMKTKLANDTPVKKARNFHAETEVIPANVDDHKSLLTQQPVRSGFGNDESEYFDVTDVDPNPKLSSSQEDNLRVFTNM